MQVGESPAGSNHPVRGELVGDAHIPGIVKLAGKRRNHRLVRLLDPAGDRSGRPQRRLIEYAGAFLESISCTDGHVRAKTILEIDRRVLICLVQRTGVLVKRESRRIVQGPMKPAVRFVQSQRRETE